MRPLPLDLDVESPLEDEPLFVVQPRASRHSNARMMPESCRLHGFDVQIHRVERGGIYGNALWQYRDDSDNSAALAVAGADYVADQVVAGFNVLVATAIPIVGYNLFNYGWRAVAVDGIKRAENDGLPFPPYDFREVIPRTIDVQDAIVETALRARHEDSTLPPLKHGAFALATILEHNDTSLVAPNTASPPHPIGALWYYMVAGGKVNVDGHEHIIPELVMDQLLGVIPRFDDALTWAMQIREHGWTRDSYVRNYRSIQDRLRAIYDVYEPMLNGA